MPEERPTTASVPDFRTADVPATAHGILSGLIRRWRRWQDRLHEARIGRSNDAAVVFDSIYAVNHWGGTESASGPGSSLAYTAALRTALPELFQDFAIRSVFDAPCGDCHWMPEVISRTTVQYHGGDIVRRVIRANRRRLEGPRMRFSVFDLTRDTFPQADLWFCRDCLFHLSYRDIHAALKNFAASGIRYALLTNHRNLTGFANTDIRTGGFRRLDLCTEPFGLPSAPLRRIREGGELGDGEHEMCLWERTAVAAALSDFGRRIGVAATRP
jgi:hypothetical protein